MHSLQKGLKPITVQKEVLLEKLIANRKIHIAEFKILQEAYNDNAIILLEKLVQLSK